MAGVYSPGKEHEDFAEWAKSQGVIIDGVAPARFEGRGLGLAATRDIKQGEILVVVPSKCLLTIDCRAARDLKFPMSSTVHGRLAAMLTIQNSDPNRNHLPWQKAWPTMKDFEATMPFCWSPDVQAQLPPPAKELLKKQHDKFAQDVKVFTPFLPPNSSDLFKYLWLTISTRVFYWSYPNTAAAHLPKKRAALTSDDCLAMCPFSDYFNHTTWSQGCEVFSDNKGFRVTSTQAYKAGEEVLVSYGTHTNDFLLVEYGFLLAENGDDSTTIDHLILPKLTKADKDALKAEDMLGKYTVSISDGKPTPCQKTLAALRLIALSVEHFHKFVAGVDDGRDQTTIDSAFNSLLDEYGEQATAAERALERLDDDLVGKSTIQKRWRETRKIINRIS